MSSADPVEPSSRPRGSRRRFLLILSALYLALIGGLLLYDAPLKSYGDMLPVAEDAPDPEENGCLYLKREWEDLELLKGQYQVGIRKVASRALPWDEELAANLRSGQENVVPALLHAVALPRWAPPLIEEKKEGKYTTSPHGWMARRTAVVRLEACAAARAGDAERAFEIWRAQHIAGMRQIEGSRDILTLLAGLALQLESASLACDLLEWLPKDTTLLARLEDLWREDPFTDAVAETALRGELRWLWTELSRSGPLQEDDYQQWPASSRWLLKKNMTMNRSTGLVRAFGGKLMVPSPTPETSAASALELAGRRGNPVSPNYFGDRMAAKWIGGMGRIHNCGLRTRRFIFRAMRVRLALQRWRLARGETPPAVLAELVPEFLPEIPADPWTGGPLGWDSATWTVSAVGYDWDAAAYPPQFSDRYGEAWIDGSNAGPGLRAKLPPSAAATPP